MVCNVKPDEESLSIEDSEVLKIPEELEIRSAGVIGDIDEEKVSVVIQSLLSLKETGKEYIEDEDGSLEIVCKPIELYVCTDGGAAYEMFSIYDVMRAVKQECEIHTIGIGKVMSAGVLLLAAGTKGKRKIGANCRVMIHHVVGGNVGDIHNLENEVQEIRWIQEQYIKALIEETSMTKNSINKILKKKVNVYLSAEKAVEFGIADIII